MCIVHSIIYTVYCGHIFAVLLPVDVTCIEKLSPIAVFHMKDGYELDYNIAFSYYP